MIYGKKPTNTETSQNYVLIVGYFRDCNCLFILNKVVRLKYMLLNKSLIIKLYCMHFYKSK
jgi:hypothetical protein